MADRALRRKPAADSEAGTPRSVAPVQLDVTRGWVYDRAMNGGCWICQSLGRLCSTCFERLPATIQTRPMARGCWCGGVDCDHTDALCRVEALRQRLAHAPKGRYGPAPARPTTIDEIEFHQALVDALVSAMGSLDDRGAPFAPHGFHATIEFLIMIGLVERLPFPRGGFQPLAELVELLRADLVQEGFPASPSKRAVRLTHSVVIEAVTAWENPELLLSGERLPARGSRDWLPFIVSAAIASADAALPLVLACEDG